MANADGKSKTVTEYIVVVETLKNSLLKDTYTFLMIVAVIATGKWIDSTVMQWVGALMLFMGAVSRMKGLPRYTPTDAVKMLVEKHGAQIVENQQQGED